MDIDHAARVFYIILLFIFLTIFDAMAISQPRC